MGMVHVGPGGTFEPSGAFRTIPSDLDEWFNSLKSPHIVLHFHGGLVPEAKGMDIATRMNAFYLEAGMALLTFVWETGLLETVHDALIEISGKRIYKKLLHVLIRRLERRVGGGDGVRGFGNAMSDQEIDRELEQPEPFADFDVEGHLDTSARGGVAMPRPLGEDREFEQFEADFRDDVYSDPELLQFAGEINEESEGIGVRGFISGITLARKLAVIGLRSLRRFISGRDHGFYPTIVEELLREIYIDKVGSFIWGQMKQKAEMMFRSNTGRTELDRHPGTYVLEQIAKLQAQDPNCTLDLVGHSAGCIAICHLMSAVAERALGVRVRRIVFLAPAGRSELGVEQIVPREVNFERFRMFTMDDSFERLDRMVPIVYPRSLLYFISGVLEPDEVDAPLMGMMRHSSRSGPFASGPAKQWADFIFGEPNRLVLSDTMVTNPNAPEGARSTARSHGDFDTDAITLGSLKAFLA